MSKHYHILSRVQMEKTYVVEAENEEDAIAEAESGDVFPESEEVTDETFDVEEVTFENDTYIVEVEIRCTAVGEEEARAGVDRVLDRIDAFFFNQPNIYAGGSTREAPDGVILGCEVQAVHQ